MASTIQRIFGRSPFIPIQQHMDICFACAELVTPLLECVAAENWGEVEHLQQQIVTLENDADDLKIEIRSNLPRGFFLPVPRPDLLELLTRQDRIANRVRGIAGLIVGRRLTFPPVLRDYIAEFARECVNACRQAREVVQELDKLLDSGFRGRRRDHVRVMVHKIDVAERHCDEIEAALRARLYSLEAGLSPVDVMFMYRVIEWIGDLANHAERVGHRLDQLLAS